MTRTRARAESSGFSLIEVVFALAMIVFCVIPLFALLTIGSHSVAETGQRTVAVDVLANASDAIRSATSTKTAGVTTYTASPSLLNNSASTPVISLTWKLGDPAQSYEYYFDAAGLAVSSSSTAAVIVLHISLTPPADGYHTGTASLSAAWPGHASYSTTQGWGNVSGFVNAYVLVNP